MNKQSKKISHVLLTTGLILTGLYFTGKVFGACTPLYGGGETCPRRGEILIDKQVRKPNEDIFVDNLTQFDPKYSPGQEVVFKLIIRNTGGDTISEITVKDIFPDFLSFVSGPGNFDQNEGKNGTLTFKIYNLAVSEQREYWVRGRVFDAKDLPENLICKLQNRGQIRADDRFDENIAEYCVEKTETKGGIPVVTEVPKTGIEVVLSFAGLSSLFGAGLVLRKKSIELVK